MTTYTAFCQSVDGTGTIWIAPVEGEDLSQAIVDAKSKCAADWDCETDDVHVLGLAEGNVKIVYWEDLNDG
jgi:hypothetical protein